MKKAFTSKAEFSDISEMPEFWIDQVIHKAYIKIDETGTEAAAATAVTMTGAGRPKTSLLKLCLIGLFSFTFMSVLLALYCF